MTWLLLDLLAFARVLADFRSLPFFTVGARGADKKRFSSAREWWWLVVGGLGTGMGIPIAPAAGAGGGCGGWCRFYRRARCGGEPQGHGTQRDKQKWTLPAPNSIEFGVGMVHFGTERDNKSTHEKFDKRFPLF